MRESTIMVTLFDFDSIKDMAKQKWGATHPGKKAHSVTVDKIGFVKTPKGTFILNEEGIIATKPLEKGGYFEFDVRVSEDLGDNKFSMAMWPDYLITISKSNFDEFKAGGQENLKDFIRTFGSRLEANFEGAKQHLIKQGAK